MFRYKNIIITPNKAVISDLEDMTADFILCSSDNTIPIANNPNILFLNFLDTEEIEHFLRFRESHAEQIIEFLSRSDANHDLFVCCDSGESRSTAIAAALTLAIGQEDSFIWECADYHPNQLVFEILCKKLGLKITKEDIKMRKERNNVSICKKILGGRR